MKNVSTRLLMACAALGVAGGVLFTAHAWVGALTVNTIPFLYGLTMGIYFLPGTLAQALFRRPGVALLTTGLAGLVASPFQLIGFQALLISLAVGVAQEIPFLLSGYRYWKRWVFWVAGLVYGLLVTGAAFGILRGSELSAVGATLVVISFFISPPLFTALALWLAEALAKAGVARGLRRSEARPRQQAADGSSEATGPDEATGR